MKPHKSRYWLNPKIDDPEEFRERVAEICGLYEQAQALKSEGTHVVSCDEKTGIQALERVRPTKPARPGQIERREFEYRRHGTLCLIGSLEVASGDIACQSIGPTRKEADFAAHLKKTVATDPDAKWIFVCDQLNTHKSESLVRWVVETLGLGLSDVELGAKGKGGILKTTATRAKFLEDPSHRIRIQYTPKHGSWMNQIEIWFGILARKVLRRGNFKSLYVREARLDKRNHSSSYQSSFFFFASFFFLWKLWKT